MSDGRGLFLAAFVLGLSLPSSSSMEAKHKENKKCQGCKHSNKSKKNKRREKMTPNSVIIMREEVDRGGCGHSGRGKCDLRGDGRISVRNGKKGWGRERREGMGGKHRWQGGSFEERTSDGQRRFGA